MAWENPVHEPLAQNACIIDGKSGIKSDTANISKNAVKKIKTIGEFIFGLYYKTSRGLEPFAGPTIFIFSKISTTRAARP